MTGQQDAVDGQVRARLAGVASLPVGEHPAVYEQVHRLLQQALDDLDGS